MTIKLVATDLDGTFFGADHRPLARNVEVANALGDKGIVVAAVTGRSWFGGYELATSTGARFDWFIGSNGGHRLNPSTGEIEERLLFDSAEVSDLLDTLDDTFDELGFGAEHHNGFWFSERFLNLYPRTPEGKPRMAYPTRDDLRDDDIGKLFVSHPTITTMELVDMVTPYVPASMYATTSGTSFVEITPDGADKGSALARLCAGLGIDRSEVIAFGDNYNDLTMLEWAGRGVAMGNAEPAVREVADEVTSTNTEHGVAQVLETLLA